MPLAIIGLGVLLVVGMMLEEIGPDRAVLAFGVGAPLGFALNRVQRLSWNEHVQQLTVTVDVVGVLVLLACWILLMLRARWLVGTSETMVQAAAIAMATTTGILATRLWQLRQAIDRALRSLEMPRAEGRPASMRHQRS
jgi:hypothetical protein